MHVIGSISPLRSLSFFLDLFGGLWEQLGEEKDVNAAPHCMSLTLHHTRHNMAYLWQVAAAVGLNRAFSMAAGARWSTSSASSDSPRGQSAAPQPAQLDCIRRFEITHVQKQVRALGPQACATGHGRGLMCMHRHPEGWVQGRGPCAFAGAGLMQGQLQGL